MSRTAKDTPKSSHHRAHATAFDFRPSNRTPKESNRSKVKIQEEKSRETWVTQPRAPKSSYEGRKVRFAPIVEERAGDEGQRRVKENKRRENYEFPEKPYVRPKMRNSFTQTPFGRSCNQVCICNCYCWNARMSLRDRRVCH